MTEEDLYRLYKGVYLPSFFHSTESLKYFEEFSFRPDDFIIVTYPKSGTTWMQEIVPLIMSGGDPASVETLPNWDRVPFLEETRAPVLILEEWPSPRVIYVMRNPKDVFTSSFHYYGMISHLVNPGLQTEFLHKFLKGKVAFGSWFDHVKGWINAEDKDRVLFISYEEMITDLKDSVSRIAEFLEKPLEAALVEKIAKKNKMSNSPFFLL